MTLDEIFEHGKDFAKFAFDAQGEIHPMWIAEDADGEIYPITVPLVDGHKEEAIAFLRAFFKDKKIVRYVALIESWMVEASSRAEADNIIGPLDVLPVSKREHRKEVVLVFAESKDGAKSGSFSIIRDNDHPKLGKFEKYDENQRDLFTNLLDLEEESGRPRSSPSSLQ